MSKIDKFRITPNVHKIPIRKKDKTKKRINPFQDQANIMWNLDKLMIQALKKESWIEALSLSYTLIEIELRFLLSSSAGKSRIPIPLEKIYKQKFLMDLANLAKDNIFIDESLWAKIQQFNEIRRKAIHRLAQCQISYEDLKEPALKSHEIMGDIQGCCLKLEFGSVEGCETWKNVKINSAKP